MTREEFIERYMARSRWECYRVDGERVYWSEQAHDYWCALPCACGEEGCGGWAMNPPNTRNWHLFMNTESGMTGEEAMALDAAWMEANPVRLATV